jgi:hypothetical protein
LFFLTKERGAIFLMYTDDNDGREKQVTAEELIPLLTRMLQKKTK